MTFGKTLGTLSSICGIKHCNLADALGYDPSYISRWINGVKLPVLRNNSDLFRQIADYLTTNAPPDAREKILAHFALDCPAPGDDHAFSSALCLLLEREHRSDREQSVIRPLRSGQENSVLGPVKDIAMFPESIFQVLRELSPTKRLDMICTMPIHSQFKNNGSFFRRVQDALPAGTELRVLQFLDMNDVASRTDISCRSFCYLISLGKKIRYEFYEFRSDNSGYIYVIRDGLLMQYLREPFSRELYLLESGDKSLISRYCIAADAYIRDRIPVAQVPDMQSLLKKQYFLDYFMQPNCRCLLRHMQPIFLPEQLREKLLAGDLGQIQKNRLFLDGSPFFGSVFLYQLALVDYIYTGRLMVFGNVVQMSREDRLIHLSHMVKQLEKSPGSLYILSTRNRVCNYDDLSLSVFTSQHAAFTLQTGPGNESSIYTVSSSTMIRQLNIWLDHMRKLPAEQCLSGQAAIDYINRCIRLL